MCVKEQDNSIDAFCEPGENLENVVDQTFQKSTFEKSYPRFTRCFSPDRIPGESMIEIESSTGLFICEHCSLNLNSVSGRLGRFYLDRKLFPKDDKARKGFVLSTTNAFPGMMPSLIFPVDWSWSP